ncbi:Oxysterol-binding protein-domain-containing protein [Microdochium bolleyi]|uniref:Oxysterol-binding protein-domain-containing protein n=1 Tax=Microdochium bolleyi TaxID=196109 RepID=A0A136J1Q3_9PEZI|nr:Oxysterol-binding protein-domain-containing protein [Microdochium bolleyi]
MAGIEQLEIHSKSYIVRWVKVDEGHTISWSIQPHKKSINFGIVKHPGTGAINLTSIGGDEDHGDGVQNNVKGGLFKKDGSSAQEQLSSKGFTLMKWLGKCEADKVSIGTYDVAKDNGGMFGLIFDNTFSKQTSKTATFVLLTYPTGLPPQGATHLPNLQAGPHAAASRTSLGKTKFAEAGPMESTDSLHSHQSHDKRNRKGSTAGRSDNAITSTSTYHTGNLLKRRRKKGQGFARRFFSLDFTTCTLSYYYNRKSSALRGAIPLSLAAIAADERRREISIDSGAEIWHLKASNADEFTAWAKALERASRIARGLEKSSGPSAKTLTVTTTGAMPAQASVEEEREWQQMEALVSRVVGTRDAMRRLVKDMAVQKQTHGQRPTSSYLSPGGTPVVAEEGESYFGAPVPEKKPFWRRRPSAQQATSAGVGAAATSALAVPSPGTATITTTIQAGRRPNGRSHEEVSTQEHCTAILNDLENVVAEFSNAIANSKRRRMPVPRSASARRSMESTASVDEFFDAEAGEEEASQVMRIDHRASEGESEGSDAEEASIHDSSSISSMESTVESSDRSGALALFPAKPKSLSPLPIDIGVERRVTIPAATIPPPSLIGFVRKNVGKDLSAISMPVSANEPTSMLQRVCEQLEYTPLLDLAAKAQTSQQRLMYVSAFAVSYISVNRSKERANRKPFNPLLGETFELLRTDSEVPGGFRLLVEKVVHRPVRLAMHADAALWSFTQSPAPAQKFWGKSAELTSDGRARIALRLPDGTDEFYSWNIATMYLRNVVMGEKYIEPVNNMTINNESSGAKATVDFPSKGVFGGRSEEVKVDIFDANGSHAGLGLSGTWTNSLRAVENGKAGADIWKAGDLVPKATSTYGLTTFAASLNEITAIEKDRLPPTDSRLRPDQRFAEQGKLDDAEEWKVKLEEAQRDRRRELEERGEQYQPKWFIRAGDEAGAAGESEEVWRFKGGKDSYWEHRATGDWKGVDEIFNV